MKGELSLGEAQARGTNILYGRSARTCQRIVFACEMAVSESFSAEPIILPTIEPVSIYEDKAGPEVKGQMYVFPDKKGRQLCLRPEATATCQLLGKTVFKMQQDVGLYYTQRCFRYERPQAGRYREFTQFGCEILNPTKDYTSELIECVKSICTSLFGGSEIEFEVSQGVQRGLGIYNDLGFEVLIPSLGAQKQVAGGGPYDGGIGFAVGVERLALALEQADLDEVW